MLRSMTPMQAYQQQLKQEDVVADPEQAAAIAALQDLYERLLKPKPQAQEPSFIGSLFQRKSKQEPIDQPEKGLYLWGGVGRGKTWLVDIFYNQLPLSQKRRVHFHHFMRETHQALAQLKKQTNPLEAVAEKIAQQTTVLCLDEFIVTDIGDAMLLAQLFDGLFSQGVSLVTTSNTAPENLYKNGLQRASFVPAIELLKQHTKVLELDSGVDYRLRYLEQATVYHDSADAQTNAKMIDEFEHLAPEEGIQNAGIQVFDRTISTRYLADDVAWFDFNVLCGPPRSQADYLEIARSFHTVFISDIPQMKDSALDDVAKRFLYLVDEFYDCSVKLIISAAAPPDKLYQNGRLSAEFERAASRLQEMQSLDYLSREHKV